MTVSSTQNRISYVGNGATVAFSTSPIVFFANGDLDVYLVVTATGVATLQTITTHYTVSGGAGATGTVTMLAAPSAAQTLLIVRTLDITQAVDFVQNDPSDAEVAEDALDRLTMVDQQLSARIARSFALADSDISGASTAIPMAVASTLIGWNAGATALQNYSAASLSIALTTPFTLTLLDDTTAAEARTTLGVSASSDAILKTLIDAAGDLLIGTAADTVGRLAIGAEATVLTSISGLPSWQALGIASIVVNAQSAGYNLVAADKGKVINCTGSFTLTATAAATLGSGWWCWIKNVSTGVITIDPNGSETISIPGGPETAATTITLPYSGAVEGPYNVSGILLWCDGSNFEVLSTLEAHGTQEFLTSGTWTCPAGVTAVWLHLSGGGGGGGGCQSSGGVGRAAGGGGSGACLTGVKATSVPGTAYTVTIGAGGAGGVNSANGTAGATTSIGALASTTGGNGGLLGATTGSAGGAANGRGGAGPRAINGNKSGHGGAGPFGGAPHGTSATSTGGAATANTGAGGSGSADESDSGTSGGAGGSGYLRVEW